MAGIRKTLIALVICLVLGASPAFGGYYDFPFIGRWQPAEDPLLIDNYGFQDIQNLRRDGNRLKGVSGHTKINTTALTKTSWTNAYIRNAFHFRKDQPSETHIIVNGGSNTGRSGSTIFDNTTAIPNQGDFAATALYTEASGADITRYSNAPMGNMLACNGEESLIWGGDELRIASLFTATDTNLANPRDETTAAQNTLQTAGNRFVVGGGNDANTVLLLHAEGAPAGIITDSSLGGAHGNATKVGNADITNDFYKFGTGSLAFDGVGDWITYADDADWDYDNGDFTIHFWFRHPDSVPISYGLFNQYQDGTNWYTLNYFDNFGGIDGLYFSVHVGGADIILVNTGSNYNGMDAPNTFYHIAIVRKDDNFTLYVDGESVATANDSDDMPNLAGLFYVGISVFYTTKGNIDEFCVVKGVARWTSDFTPPDRAYQTARSFVMLGSTRPIQGFKAYVAVPNITTSGSSLWSWTGATWGSLAITDNTISGGIALAQTGTVTFDSTVDSAVPRFFEGEYNYWYKYRCGAGYAEIYNVTLDTPVQDVVNIWDGIGIKPMQFQVFDGGIWEDYTEEVLEEGLEDFESNPIAGELDDLANTEYVYIGFPVRVSGVKWNILAEHENDTAATVTVYYWNGAAWVSVGTVTDETKIGANSLAGNGWMYWTQPGAGEEFQQNEFGVPAYYYKFMWDIALGLDVLVDTVIAGGVVDTIDGYKFPLMFQGRSFLCSENAGQKNKCIYSMFNASDVWNGNDTGELLFGADTELVAGAVIYNVYRTAGVHQALICKQNETYRIFGDSPETWVIDQLSANIGCAAPLSMAVCDVADISPDTKRHVAIWQAGHGVVMCDGATIVTISDDIKNYWDPNSSDYIPAAYQDNSDGCYNPNLGTYTLLISSGSGQTTHNVELEYSLKHQNWTKIYRENTSGANPLKVGFQVHSTTGTAYTYGTTDEGYMYRLENGNSWDSTAIDYRLWTKNLLLSNELPYWMTTSIDYMRLAFEDKTATYDETISISHYCDNNLTVNGASDQDTWDDITIDHGPYDTQDVNLTECLMHSFLITSSSSNVSDGLELLSLGFMFEEYGTIMEKVE